MNPLFDELQRHLETTTNQSNRKKISEDPWRLTYHVMPPVGWLNDPNGVCQFNGTYHLYYQYSPTDPNGGLKYWGHATSEDLVTFTDHGIALYPDQSYDLHGVYSGSAFIKDDLIHFFYTGNVKHLGNHDYITSGREQNTIHAVSRDGGKTIEKQEVIIHSSDYPQSFSNHVRDPKVTQIGETYYLILGARDRKDQGQILVYESNDLNQWSYVGVFAGPIAGLGYMWECPDFFNVNGSDILLMSPQGLQPENYRFQNVYQAGYLMGQADWNEVKFNPTTAFDELDRGFDFYAPQTFEDEQGRRILWAWMGLPDEDGRITNPTIDRGWQHAMTLPRELVVEKGKLYQRPLPDYKKLRHNEVELSLSIDGNRQVDELHGEVFEMIVNVDRMGAELNIHLRQDTIIQYNQQEQLLTLSLGSSGYGRKKRSVKLDKLENIQIFSDTSSLEFFVNDGEHVFTTRLYPESEQDRIAFSGEAVINVKKWGIKKA